MKLTESILKKIILEELEKQQEEGAEELYNAVMALLLATGSEDDEMEEAKASSAPKRRAALKRLAKERAGIAKDLKYSEFTDGQKKLYHAAKKDLKLEDEVFNLEFQHNLMHGDLLDLPIVKQLAQKNPKIAAFIKGVASGGRELSLNNLFNQFVAGHVTGE
jgi:hypothetical protein